MTRVVLVAPMGAGGDNVRLSRSLDFIASVGWTLVALVDPADFRTAYRMIADDQADVLVAASRQDLPSTVFVADAPPAQRRPLSTASNDAVSPAEVARAAPGVRRTQMLPRPAEVASPMADVPARQRRPQRINRA